jgi:hypothetical protein
MKPFALAAGLLLLPAAAQAQQHSPAHAPGMVHHLAQPLEPGQSAFGAIQEIVALLEADPATDWSRVDIEALRRHLIDMNAVTLDAEVAAEPIPGGARFTAGGTGRVRDSIRRMVMAHAATMAGGGGWMFAAQEAPDGAVLTVTTADPAGVAEIRALGFIGVLTRGMHHQTHHLMIAAGGSPHH